MGLNLFNSHALVRVSLEEAANEVFAFNRYLLPSRGSEFKLSCFNQFKKLHVILMVEWGSAAEENEEGDSKTPVITPLVIRLSADDFRSDVSRSASGSSGQVIKGDRAS